MESRRHRGWLARGKEEEEEEEGRERTETPGRRMTKRRTG